MNSFDPRQQPIMESSTPSPTDDQPACDDRPAKKKLPEKTDLKSESVRRDE